MSLNMSLNIDLQTLAKASIDELKTFHLDEQVPRLAAGLTSGECVYYQGRLVAKSSSERSELPADSFTVPSYKELDVVIQRVDDLITAEECTPTEEFEKNMTEIRKFAEVSRILTQESKQEVAIESVLLNKSVDSVANVLGTMFK